ncbi:hypothetical protein NSQ62_11770 [Solibacillus sp. FSL H8-0523]|uniref:hypothetical protein n=1 Tax=Solibacillus sp. FSL H8-0523 TaxID=2954511 RepID=UPI003100BFAC
MDTVKSAPCSNCGGVSFTYPTRVGLPKVTIDEQKKVTVDVSMVVPVDFIVCNTCDNIKFFRVK